MTSLAVAVGSQQLLQLGVSYSDIALLLNQGRKLGNWYRAADNEKEFLDSIHEDVEAVLQRRGLVDVVEMERRWSIIHFIYEGNHHDTTRLTQSDKNATPSSSGAEARRLSSLSWLMIPIITALDLCMSSSGIRTLIMNVFVRVLDREAELEESLRVLLPTSIESWRSTGCARYMTAPIASHIRAAIHKMTGETAVPQLNQAETIEAEAMLIWLLRGASNTFSATSAIIYAMAVAIGKSGIKVRTDGKQSYETEPIVYYSDSNLNLHEFGGDISKAREHYRLEQSQYTAGQAEQIAYPRGKPDNMIHSVPASRETINSMILFWKSGYEASKKMELCAKAFLPFSRESDVYFTLNNHDDETSCFSADVMMVASPAFPARSESILLTIEKLVNETSSSDITWLSEFLDLRRLTQREGTYKPPSFMSQGNLLWKFQAIVFGFYYGLLEPLLSMDLVQENAYFRGLWGKDSTLFLSQCLEFGNALRLEGRVSRTHILYILSTMYNARPKPFPRSSARTGLLGVLGSISILSNSLFHTTDNPKKISKFVLTDIPVLDLGAESDGELFGGGAGGFPFNNYEHRNPTVIKPRGPENKWSLHAKMGSLYGDGSSGVVVAARCAGRLIGWFNPLAADIAFLSDAYLEKRHDNDQGYIDQSEVKGYEITDHHWQTNRLPRPANKRVETHIGLVQSLSCPALRYAAAGIYLECGEAVIIATDDINAACRALSGSSGIVIG